MNEAVYVLKPFRDPPRFDGFVMVDTSSLTGSSNIYIDFKKHDFSRRDWQSPRLLPYGSHGQ